MLRPRLFVVVVSAVLFILLGVVALEKTPAPQEPVAPYYETAMPGLYYIPTTGVNGANYPKGLHRLLEEHPDQECQYWGSMTSQYGTTAHYVRCVPREQPACDCAIPAQELVSE